MCLINFDLNNNQMNLTIYIFSFIFLNKITFEKKIEAKEIKFDYHPIKIYFDFKQLEQSKVEKRLIKKLKNMLKQVGFVLSQFIYIKNIKLIKSNLEPKNFCNSNIIYYDKNLLKGINADLLIYPIFQNLSKKNYQVHGEICAKDVINKRPNIGILFFNRNINYKKNKIIENYFINTIHHLIHILGFNKLYFKDYKILSNRNILFYYIKNINEKYLGKWVGINLKKSFKHYTNFQYDIMSRKKNNRILIFTSQTLYILQRLKYYQINLSLCGCSLKGDFEFLSHPISIYISKNLNGDYNSHCFLNINMKNKCEYLNNTLIPKTKIKKINTNNNNYFEGNHCLNKYEIFENYLPNKDSQTINLLNPKKNGKCKNKQRTIFLYYPDYLNITQDLKDYNIEKYTITNKNMMLYFSYVETGNYDYPPIKKSMEYNKIPKSYFYYLANYISFEFNTIKLPEVYGSLCKYCLSNHFIDSMNYYDNKAILYLNYRGLEKLFPNDFNFIPESYILKYDKKILKQKFKNYVQTKDDLWIYKPPEGLQGVGIKFLKNSNDFLKYSFISKYISNPHLLKGRKYHIRMYVIVTGFTPLKIYIYNEGQVMRAAHNYSYELSKIENNTASITNGHFNFKDPNYNHNATFNTDQGTEWSINVLKNYINKNGGNWEKIWNEIKNISVKSILINFNIIKNKLLNDFKFLRSNNIVQRFGFDIMIDDNMKPWLLEINGIPGMALYNIINLNNKIGVDTDFINLIGLVPFERPNIKPLDEEIKYKNKIDEELQISICEFERPLGGLERIFPVKNTLNYYKQFILEPDEFNIALWNLIENGEI